MKKLNQADIQLMETLISSPQSKTKLLMSKYLRSKYPKVLETEHYVLAEGDIPIALVAHMDTVFEEDMLKKSEKKELLYDSNKNMMYSPQGAGFDDKAGIFAIIQIIRSGLRPHIILTTDEEIGGAGASKISMLDQPFKDLRYVIQLDRRGSDDCVFYDCENPEFIEYVEKFGFVYTFGSFSDISFICPSWEIAGVNLSIGYRDEHTYREVLFVGQMLSTIEKVKKMLTEEEIPVFKYIPSRYGYSWFNIPATKDYGYGVLKCKKCKQYFMEEEMFPIVTQKGDTEFLCPDCLVDNVGWCRICGSAFEKPCNEAPDDGICPKCEELEKRVNDKSRNL